MRNVVQRGHDLGPRRLGPPRTLHPLSLPKPHPDAAAEAARPRPVPRLKVVVQGSPAFRSHEGHVGGGAGGRAATAAVELKLVGQIAAVGLELQQQNLKSPSTSRGQVGEISSVHDGALRACLSEVEGNSEVDSPRSQISDGGRGQLLGPTTIAGRRQPYPVLRRHLATRCVEGNH